MNDCYCWDMENSEENLAPVTEHIENQWYIARGSDSAYLVCRDELRGGTEHRVEIDHCPWCGREL